MIGGGTAQLQVDLRFRAAPIAVRGAYRMLLDFVDACGDIVAKGKDGVGAVALALDCPRAEAEELVRGMVEHELARLEESRLCLLVGTVRGKLGGMSGTERSRRSRAKAAEVAAAPPAAPTSPAPKTPAANDATALNGAATGQVPETTSVVDSRNGLATDACNGQRGSLPLSPSPSPLHPSSSLSLTLSPLSPSGRVAADAAPAAEAPNLEAPKPPATQGALFGAAPQTPAPKPEKPKRERKPKAEPVLPFKIGDALAALAEASGGRFDPGEGRDVTNGYAVRITAAVKRYPVLDEWRVCGEWLAAGGHAHEPTPGLAWVSSASLYDAMAKSRRWNADGRPALVGRIALPSAAPPQATREQIAERLPVHQPKIIKGLHL